MENGSGQSFFTRYAEVGLKPALHLVPFALFRRTANALGDQLSIGISPLIFPRDGHPQQTPYPGHIEQRGTEHMVQTWY